MPSVAADTLLFSQEEKLSVEGAGVAGLAALLPGGPLHEVQ